MPRFFKRFLIVFLISFVFSATTFASTIGRPMDNAGLVGYWNFEEGTGLKAFDKSGNGFNGTLTNGPTWLIGNNQNSN